MRLEVIASLAQFGHHTAIVRLSTGETNSQGQIINSTVASKDVPVTFVYRDLIGADSQSMAFESTEASTQPIAAQIINVTGTLVEWSINTDVPWLNISPTQGTGPTSVTVSIDATNLTSEAHKGALTIKDNNYDESITVQVDFNLHEHRILAETTGVALSKLNSRSVLSGNIRITDNLSSQTTWQASTVTPWLVISEAGTTGEYLNIAVDETLITNDGFYTGKIEITSAAASIRNSERIYVGLFVHSGDVLDVDTERANIIEDLSVQKIGDPIRSYVYISNGAPGVYAVNLYTGEFEPTLTLTGIDGIINNLAISENGQVLYAYRSHTSGDKQAAIIAYDLTNRQVLDRWDLSYKSSHVDFIFMRPNGKDLLASEWGDVYDVSSGEQVGEISQFSNAIDINMIVSRSSAMLFSFTKGTNYGYFEPYNINYSYINNKFESQALPAIQDDLYAYVYQTALTTDGVIVTTSASQISPPPFRGFVKTRFDSAGNHQLMQLEEPPYDNLSNRGIPNSVAVDGQDRVYGSVRRFSADSAAVVAVYNTTGDIVHEYTGITDIINAGIFLSSDNNRLFILSDPGRFGDPLKIYLRDRAP